MRQGWRIAAVPATLLVLVATAVCASAVHVLSLLPSAASPGSAPLVPLLHGGPHPGAAVLAGDASGPSNVSFIPTTTAAPGDLPPYWHHCHAPGTKTAVLECVLGDTTGTPKKVIALVGDSATGAWMIPLDVIGKARHWKIITMLHSLCAWTAAMTVHLVVSRGPFTACHTWGENAQSLLLKLKPDVVISSDRPKVRTPALIDGGTGASIAVGVGMATYWRQLLAAGIAVVAMRETPEPGHDMPTCVATKAIRACSTPKAAAIASTTPVTVADRAVHGEDSLLDLNNVICTALCSPVVGNVLVYRDTHHLTRTFALSLAPYLERKLLTVAALSTG